MGQAESKHQQQARSSRADATRPLIPEPLLPGNASGADSLDEKTKLRNVTIERDELAKRCKALQEREASLLSEVQQLRTANNKLKLLVASDKKGALSEAVPIPTSRETVSVNSPDSLKPPTRPMTNGDPGNEKVFASLVGAQQNEHSERPTAWMGGISQCATEVEISTTPAASVDPSSAFSDEHNQVTGTETVTLVTDLSPFKRFLVEEYRNVADTIVNLRELVKASTDWPGFDRRCVQSLDEDDIDAIHLYTGTDAFATLNKCLREGKVDQKVHFQPWVDQLCEAIAKLPRVTKKVYRILNNNDATANYTKGSDVVWPAFTSCTTEITTEHVTLFGAQTGDASALLVIHVDDAGELGPLNPYGEREVLLSPGWHGTVIDNLRDGLRDEFAVCRNSTIVRLSQAGHAVQSPFSEVNPYGLTTEQAEAGGIEMDLSTVTAFLKMQEDLPEYEQNLKWIADLYVRALTFEPKNAAYHGNYGLVLAKLGELEAAAEHFKEATQLDLRSSVLFYNYAYLLHYKQKQHQQAVEFYEKAIALDPKDTRPLKAYGDLLRELDEPVKAARHYEQAVELDPENAYLVDAHATLLGEMNRFSDAERMFDRAIKLDPGRAATYSNYASLLASQPDCKQRAVQLLERAVKLDPNDAGILCNYALLLTICNDLRKAAAVIDQAHRIDPNSAKICYNYGRICFNIAQYEKAAEYYALAVEREPNHASAYKYRAQALTELGRLEEAARCYKRSIDLGDVDDTAIHNLAVILEHHPDALR